MSASDALTHAAGDLIGTLHTDRLACQPPTHTLVTGNPWYGDTWCRCGQVRLSGQHAVWRERYVYDGAGRDAELLGFDRYRLSRCACHLDGVIEENPCT